MKMTIYFATNHPETIRRIRAKFGMPQTGMTVNGSIGGEFAIVTNPPYKYALEFVQHSLEIVPDGCLVCMFLKTTFAEGKTRYNQLFRFTPPIYILQCIERVLCAKNADFDYMVKHGGSAVSYAWWVWQKGYKGKTILDWI